MIDAGVTESVGNAPTLPLSRPDLRTTSAARPETSLTQLRGAWSVIIPGPAVAGHCARSRKVLVHLAQKRFMLQLRPLYKAVTTVIN